MEHNYANVIKRPSLEDAMMIRTLTLAEKRSLGPGWPLVRFVNVTTGAELVTRDADLYRQVADWTERPL